MARRWIGQAIALSLLATTPMASPLPAQELPRVSLGGQVRPRFEARSPVAGDWDTFTSMRVRGSLDAALQGGVRIFIQLQDVRLFGEEANTLADYRADNLDLHQGYLELGRESGARGFLRVGRQELLFGEQRLVGSVDWSQQGRSFDGLRYTTPALGPLLVNLFATKLREDSSPNHQEDAAFLGAYGTLALGTGGAVDLYALGTTDSRDPSSDEVTVGALWRGEVGPMAFRLEGSAQGGERAGEDVSAWMFGARMGVTVAKGTSLTLWYDLLSGDDDPQDGQIGVFSTLFATNHAFYGFADYFTDIPVHTAGLGLEDAAVKLAWTPTTPVRVNLDLHAFRAQKQGSLSTRSLANELDLTLSYRYSAPLTLTGGYSFVQARDGIRELERLGEDAHWAYLMLNVAF